MADGRRPLPCSNNEWTIAFVVCLVFVICNLTSACFTSRSPSTVTIVTNGTTNCTSCSLSQLDIDNTGSIAAGFRTTSIVSQTTTFGTNCSQISITCTNSPNTLGAVEFIFNSSPSGGSSLPNNCNAARPTACFDQLVCDNLGRWTAQVDGSTVVVKSLFCKCITTCTGNG